ncbi:MAG: nucleotidyltransferase family protein, partial [Lachnospiraceae bacterium]|nr:nucleotidyltransferase family protein [Lachnospiraceae bacterium]
RQSKDTLTAEKEQGLSLYARILGFRRKAGPLLSEIDRRASIPLVSKLADASKTLSPLAFAQLEQTRKASELYRTAMSGAKSGSEYAQRIIIL